MIVLQVFRRDLRSGELPYHAGVTLARVAVSVALARAFAVEPDLLLMDEPFVSLDESTADGLRRLLLQIWQAKPTTVLFVTHDSREAIQLAQRIIVLCASPATIVRDQGVALTAEQRADPLQLEALREQFR